MGRPRFAVAAVVLVGLLAAVSHVQGRECTRAGKINFGDSTLGRYKKFSIFDVSSAGRLTLVNYGLAPVPKKIMRQHLSADADFSYTLRDLNPTREYDVLLNFAETDESHCVSGRRIFSVRTGPLSTGDIDVFDRIGCGGRLVVTLTVTPPSDGAVQLDFVKSPGSAANPMISALAVMDCGLADRPPIEVDTPLDRALDTLKADAEGTTKSTAASLVEIRQLLSGTSDEFHDSRLFAKALEVIEVYETTQGPLFTEQGVERFVTADSDTDGNALARAIHEVYLGVMDSITPALMASDPQLINNLVFRTSAYFPGKVDPPADPSAVYEVLILASVPRDFGRPDMYAQELARRPTGAYLAPGSIAEIVVPVDLVGKGCQVLVGAHTWDLSTKPTQTRLARATTSFPITGTTTKVANPMGGGIYIMVPPLLEEGIVSVKIKNTVRAPFFSNRGFDDTSEDLWLDTERNHPGPWADFESEQAMLSVPSKWVRNFDDVVELMDNYDAIVESINRMMAFDDVRSKPPLFLQVDTVLRGYAFFPGYPMSNFPSFNSDEPAAPFSIDAAMVGATMHEHGHAIHITKFPGEVESIVHMPYVVAANKVYGDSMDEAFGNSLAYHKGSGITTAVVLNSWLLTDFFLADENMSGVEMRYQLRGYGKYIDYVKLFGWEAFEDFNRELHFDFEEGVNQDFSRNDHPPNDRILRLSRSAGVDVRPLMHIWGRKPVDTESDLAAELEDEDLSPSAAIYDLLVGYKGSIPSDQAEFDRFHELMSPVLSPLEVDLWNQLVASYDLSRGQAAAARVQGIIDLYFPAGRPLF